MEYDESTYRPNGDNAAFADDEKRGVKMCRVPAFETERLFLRPCAPDDTDELFRIFSDPQVMQFWNSPPVTEREAAARFFDDANKDESGQWAIVRRRDDVLVGTCTLMHVNSTHRRAELAYALAREHWGNGYMGEGLRRLIQFAFGELDLIRLEADVDPRNLASIRTLERLGFQREGYLRARWIVSGEFQDAFWYGLLAREWVP